MPRTTNNSEQLRKLLSQSIDDWGHRNNLSVRAYSCLERAGIHTVGALVQKTESELWHIKNCGAKTLKEIKDLLPNEGLSLGMRLDPDGLPLPPATPSVQPDSAAALATMIPSNRRIPWLGYRAISRLDWGHYAADTDHPVPRLNGLPFNYDGHEYPVPPAQLHRTMRMGCLLRQADAADATVRTMAVLPGALDIISATMGRILSVLDALERAFPAVPATTPVEPAQPPEPPIPDTIQDEVPGLTEDCYQRLREAHLTTVELVHQAGLRGLHSHTRLGARRIFELLDLLEDAGKPLPLLRRDTGKLTIMRGQMRSYLKKQGRSIPPRWDARRGLPRT